MSCPHKGRLIPLEGCQPPKLQIYHDPKPIEQEDTHRQMMQITYVGQNMANLTVDCHQPTPITMDLLLSQASRSQGEVIQNLPTNLSTTDAISNEQKLAALRERRRQRDAEGGKLGKHGWGSEWPLPRSARGRGHLANQGRPRKPLEQLHPIDEVAIKQEPVDAGVTDFNMPITEEERQVHRQNTMIALVAGSSQTIATAASGHPAIEKKFKPRPNKPDLATRRRMKQEKGIGAQKGFEASASMSQSEAVAVNGMNATKSQKLYGGFLSDLDNPAWTSQGRDNDISKDWGTSDKQDTSDGAHFNRIADISPARLARDTQNRSRSMVDQAVFELTGKSPRLEDGTPRFVRREYFDIIIVEDAHDMQMGPTGNGSNAPTIIRGMPKVKKQKRNLAQRKEARQAKKATRGPARRGTPALSLPKAPAKAVIDNFIKAHGTFDLSAFRTHLTLHATTYRELLKTASPSPTKVKDSYQYDNFVVPDDPDTVTAQDMQLDRIYRYLEQALNQHEDWTLKQLTAEAKAVDQWEANGRTEYHDGTTHRENAEKGLKFAAATVGMSQEQRRKKKHQMRMEAKREKAFLGKGLEVFKGLSL